MDRKFHPRSIRLKGYDYTNPGAYFITICSRDGECLLGEVANETMSVNELEQVVQDCWGNIPIHFVDVELDVFLVMPNHLQGIIVLVNHGRRGTACHVPTEFNRFNKFYI